MCKGAIKAETNMHIIEKSLLTFRQGLILNNILHTLQMHGTALIAFTGIYWHLKIVFNIFPVKGTFNGHQSNYTNNQTRNMYRLFC